MKQMMKTLFMAAALAAFALPAIGQTEKSAQVFPSSDVNHQLQSLADEAKAKGSSGATLGDYGSHALKLSVRTVSGGAEVHTHFDDIMVVTGGTAELNTGGTVIDPQTGANGEIKGSGIRGGKTQTIVVGDIVHIPAGVPHQMIVPKGTTFSAFVVKVHE